MFSRLHRQSANTVRIAPQLENLEDRLTPVVITVPDIYTVERGKVTVIPAADGLLKNDFSTKDFSAILSASLAPIDGVTSKDTLRALPPDTVVVNPDGSLIINPPDLNFPDIITELKIRYDVVNLNNPGEITLPGFATITVTEPRQEFFAVGAGIGGAPLVKVYRPGSGELVRSFYAYEETFTGGVRVATGDLNRDGVDDIITVPGPGGSARVKVFDGRSNDVLFDQIFLDPDFRGGGYVAVGDQLGNGDLEIILGAGEGGGPVVTVIEHGLDPVITPGAKGILQFFAYDPNLRSGVRVAAGDVVGRGYDNIITAPGQGGGPHVKVFDAVEIQRRAVAAGFFKGFNIEPTFSFFAASADDRSGVYVAAGDLDGDGKVEIITSTASEGPSILRVFSPNGGLLRSLNIPVDPVPPSGQALFGTGLFQNTLPQSGILLNPTLPPGSLVSGDPNLGVILPGVARGGVTVATIDWDQDGIDEIVVGAGPGNTPRVRILDAAGAGDPVEINRFIAYESTFIGGVFVGG